MGEVIRISWLFSSNGDNDEMGNASSAAEYNDVNPLPSIIWVKNAKLIFEAPHLAGGSYVQVC